MTTKHHSPRVRTVFFLSALALGGLVTAGVLYAGPLNPPAGAVAPTAKPIAEVEPRTAINATNTPGTATALFRITQPGSYYLTGNITGVVGKNGIEIAASGVTIDLTGFDLVGAAGMGAFDGVSVNGPSLRGIAVVNGSVRNWGDDGIDLGTANASSCRVEGVLATGNAGIGISVGGGCTVSNCAAGNNSGAGISASNGCTVLNCAAYTNIGFANTVSNCSAYSNAGAGFTTGSSCTVTGCSALGNGTIGIAVNTSCTITGCIASASGTTGISAGSGCTVTDCTARTNNLEGILCGSSCVIRGNTCSTNGLTGDGACIHVTGADTRIEGNNCTGTDRGIDVDTAGNMIIRNTCSGNTINWVIAANNYYGPIIDRTGVATAAVNGPAAAGTLATTDPNANFSY